MNFFASPRGSSCIVFTYYSVHNLPLVSAIAFNLTNTHSQQYWQGFQKLSSLSRWKLEWQQKSCDVCYHKIQENRRRGPFKSTKIPKFDPNWLQGLNSLPHVSFRGNINITGSNDDLSQMHFCPFHSFGQKESPFVQYGKDARRPHWDESAECSHNRMFRHHHYCEAAINDGQTHVQQLQRIDWKGPCDVEKLNVELQLPQIVAGPDRCCSSAFCRFTKEGWKMHMYMYCNS